MWMLARMCCPGSHRARGVIANIRPMAGAGGAAPWATVYPHVNITAGMVTRPTTVNPLLVGRKRPHHHQQPNSLSSLILQDSVTTVVQLLSVLPHISVAPASFPLLVIANGKPIAAWGRANRLQTFHDRQFKCSFLLTAASCPILSLDFLAAK
jgi:hypothetical protein